MASRLSHDFHCGLFLGDSCFGQPNARHQAWREAGAQRTLYAVACMPLFGSGYDSQQRLIDFPIHTPRLEQLPQFVTRFLGCNSALTKRLQHLPGNPRNGEAHTLSNSNPIR